MARRVSAPVAPVVSEETEADKLVDEELDEVLSIGDDEDDDDDFDADDLDEDDDDLEDDDDDEESGDLEDGEDEPFDTPAVEPETVTPVRDVVSALALRTLSPKMRARPLSAQSNQWVLSTMGRLYDEYVDGVQDGEPISKDLAVLFAAAGVRNIVSQLSDLTRDGIRHLVANYGVGAVVATSGIAAPASTALVPVRLELVVELPVSDVAPDPDQPRDEGADDEIGNEMHPDTVLPPIEVRPHPFAGTLIPNASAKPIAYPSYMIVDGERRWRGSIKAGRTHIRAIVNDRPLDAGDLLLRQAALNQGKRLKPLEEARAWKRIVDAKQWSVQQLADYLAKPRSTVADRVAMLEAPKPFLKLFEQGILTPSAAPLIRPLGELDDATATEILNVAADSLWDDNMQDGVAIPLDDVEHGLLNGLREVGFELTDATLKKQYTGQRITLGKRAFALDVEEIDRLLAAQKRADAERSKSDRAAAPAPAKVNPDVERYKAQRAKEEKARKAKGELRLAQFRAVAAKLPKTLTRDWALFLARGLIGELTQDTARLAVRALALREAKSASGGLNFDTDLRKHAESLKSPVELLHFMSCCIMAHELYVSPNYDSGTKRLGEAAKLAGVNLAKVKAPDPAAAKKATPATKPSPVKKKVKNGGG